MTLTEAQHEAVRDIAEQAHTNPDAAGRKAAALTEALPWIQRFVGSTIVFKFGGHVMTDPALTKAFAADMVFLRSVGIKPVIVHGGGPQISAMLNRLGIDTEFRAGLRVTTPEAMNIVRMVLVGNVGRELVGAINAHGPYAVGMSGEDGGLFTAQRSRPTIDGDQVDIGLVGGVTKVDPHAIHALQQAGKIPVVATVAPDGAGEILNVNADTGAAALAIALGAVKLVMLTDVPGLYADWPHCQTLIGRLNTARAQELLPTLSAGMAPKIGACVTAVRGGVAQAQVIDGRNEHAVLREVFTDRCTGTMVVDDDATS